MDIESEIQTLRRAQARIRRRLRLLEKELQQRTEHILFRIDHDRHCHGECPLEIDEHDLSKLME